MDETASQPASRNCDPRRFSLDPFIASCWNRHQSRKNQANHDTIQVFNHILRLLNTNIDGKRKIMYALTEIKGVGRRYANVVCKKADVDLAKRWAAVSHLNQV